MAGIVIAIDQVTKAIASKSLGRDADTHRFEMLGSLLAFEYIENTGAAFGVLEGQGIILTLVATAIVALLIWRYLRVGQSSPLVGASLGLLVGGAFGNVIDRVRLGYVVDFVAVGVWPKFNVADSAVTVGVVLVVWSMSREDITTRQVQAGNSVDGDERNAPMECGPIGKRYVEGG